MHYCGKPCQKKHWKTHKSECICMKSLYKTCVVCEKTGDLTTCLTCRSVYVCSAKTTDASKYSLCQLAHGMGRGVAGCKGMPDMAAREEFIVPLKVTKDDVGMRKVKLVGFKESVDPFVDKLLALLFDNGQIATPPPGHKTRVTLAFKNQKLDKSYTMDIMHVVADVVSKNDGKLRTAGFIPSFVAVNFTAGLIIPLTEGGVNMTVCTDKIVIISEDDNQFIMDLHWQEVMALPIGPNILKKMTEQVAASKHIKVGK